MTWLSRVRVEGQKRDREDEGDEEDKGDGGA
jgi:hypothetical protein